MFAAADSSADLFVVSTIDGPDALVLTQELRREGWRVERAYDGRSMKAQMKAANKSGAPLTLIVGETEAADGTVSVRPMAGGDQVVVSRSELIPRLKDMLP